MERSWLVAVVVGIAALAAGGVSMEEALGMLPGWCVFLSGIVFGWWACCKVYLNGCFQEGAAPDGMRSFTGTYRDPQKDEQWVIREAGMVSLRCDRSGRILTGWVADDVLTVQFLNRNVKGWLEGPQLVWRSNARPWIKC